MGEPLIRMKDIRKSYGRVKALDGVDFHVNEGLDAAIELADVLHADQFFGHRATTPPGDCVRAMNGAPSCPE